MPTPEQQARQDIDAALQAAGWAMQDMNGLDLRAARGVAIREFPLKHGYGHADYLLYVDGQAAGVIEAKKEGTTLTGVEIQAEKYSVGIPDHLPAPQRPLPFLYQSTGVETRFTNRLDPDPRSRQVFHFHQPATLAGWLAADPLWLPTINGKPDPRSCRPSTLRSRMQAMPSVDERGMWPAQVSAIRNLEVSLREDRPRALIQMATGSGKTFTAVTAAYRLIKFADAKRILFLVDRGNLGRQALNEFQNYVAPDDQRKFAQLYNIQHLKSNTLDGVARVAITTIQRLYSMLKGEPDLPPELEEGSQFDTAGGIVREPVPVAYNPALPPEYFDIIFVDECHRSIYSLWRQVLEYFDAHIIGLTATPAKHTFGFFKQNLVMEYGHEQAVADGVNVDFDVYRIRTKITEQGSTVEAGPYEQVGKRERQTRKMRWEKLDEDLTYDSSELDRDVVAVDQIRTVIRSFRDKLPEILPGRNAGDVPKTLIYAKDDSHADDIVQVVREEFGKGNTFCEKITYRTGTARIVTVTTGENGQPVEQVAYQSTGVKPDNLLQAFRNSYLPRIVVTVDMIATGTDIRPLEIVMFMRSVKSRNFFEQMKGRGVRIVSNDDFQAVTMTPGATKDHFVIVDCVGVTEQELSDTYPLDRQPSIPFDKLLTAVALGSTDPDILSTLASRLARLHKQLDEPQRQSVAQLANGRDLSDIAGALIDAIDPDKQVEEARRVAGPPVGQDPPQSAIEQAAKTLITAAALPIASNPALRNRLVEIKKSLEQTIDQTSKDEVLDAGFSADAKEKAKGIVTSFRQFIEDNKDEITALQVLYSRPFGQRLRYEDIAALANVIKLPPRCWTPDVLWRAYETLDRDRVRGASGQHLLTDVVSLVRFALGQEQELVPYPEKVEQRFQVWLAQQGDRFKGEQLRWLEMIRDQIAASAGIEMDDFDFAPFVQHGGAGKAFQVFGQQLGPILNELNEVLAA